jgi:hypothetical protein
MSGDVDTWLAELRQKAGMPPAGVDKTTHEREQAAEKLFQTIFGTKAQDVSAIGEHVVIEHLGLKFVFVPDDQALYFQPRDANGNDFGQRREIWDIPSAVEAIEANRRTS